MTRAARPAFPELRRVFSGYLHEDFAVEYGSPAAALRAFREDADGTELRRFRREARAFLADTAGLELDELQRRVAALGGRWAPPSREALRSVLAPDGE